MKSAFRLRELSVEPSSPAGLLAALGGVIAASAYLVDTGWRTLLLIAILLWSFVAAGRLWVYLLSSSIALRGLHVEYPLRVSEGARFRLVINLPRFIPPGSLRVSASLPRGLRLEDIRQSLGRVELMLSGRIGEWCIKELTIESIDPLGTFRFKASASGSACTTITPRPVAVPPFSRIFGAKRVEGTGRRGAGIDYYTFREYQFGDEPRMIEWKATARLRVPVVKETEEARSEEAVAVVFVGCIEDYSLDSLDSLYERAARIAYSIVKAAVEAGERVHLYVAPHIMEKPLPVEDSSGLPDAGEAIARGGLECSKGIDLPLLDVYERAVIVSSRRIKGVEAPTMTPEDL